MAQKAIGPNFANEVEAAGLSGLPFTWSVDGEILYGAAITAPQRAQIDALYAAHDPARPDPRAEAAKLLAGGLAITSVGTPVLNGTYGTGMQDEINITGLQAAVQANVFPGWYRDVTGVRKVMTGAQFTAIATAALNFIAAVEDAMHVALEGGAWVAPPAQANLP
jgi:hypothetical protein